MDSFRNAKSMRSKGNAPPELFLELILPMIVVISNLQ